MFNYTKAELAEMAGELNFIRDTLEKAVRLVEILDYLNGNPFLKSRLALKGGTAINLAVFQLPRLSVDIDLDYCVETSRQEMLADRAQMTEEIKIYMQTQGYSLGPQSKEHHSLDSFVYFYTNLGGMPDNIKIEINYSLRSHLFEPIECELKTLPMQIENRITVLDPMELFAAKINALLNRGAARDLYDTYNMVYLGLFSQDFLMLRKAVIFYTAISQEEIPETYELTAIENINIRKIRRELLPVVHKGEFIKLEQIKREVKDYLEVLLVPTAEEKMFLHCFSEKQYRPELLFSDKAIIERIRNHPMALWKMQDHTTQQ